LKLLYFVLRYNCTEQNTNFQLISQNAGMTITVHFHGNCFRTLRWSRSTID